MFKLTIISNPTRSVRWLLGGCLIILMSLMLPAVVLADSPESCDKCHAEEIEAWQSSPHANVAAGVVTCEDCHGAYVEDHPKEGLMQLTVDSSVCKNCHTETFEQWQDSSHGQANVQCISCHLSHSQEFRLTDEALCQTCHHEQLNDFAHATHHGADMACTDCHVSTVSRDLTGSASLTELTGGGAPPNHSFAVTSKVCIDCHERAPAKSTFQPAEPANPGDGQISELATKLKVAEQTNLSLKGLSVANLGLGLGIGGILGIIFVLVTGRLSQRSMRL